MNGFFAQKFIKHVTDFAVDIGIDKMGRVNVQRLLFNELQLPACKINRLPLYSSSVLFESLAINIDRLIGNAAGFCFANFQMITLLMSRVVVFGCGNGDDLWFLILLLT
ncbi:MAG: hypothetical protein LBI18_02755 [Planctomycetaceae bacterium]|nr:hypothetical protein [Planctomycetaceae bacterium]